VRLVVIVRWCAECVTVYTLPLALPWAADHVTNHAQLEHVPFCLLIDSTWGGAFLGTCVVSVL